MTGFQGYPAPAHAGGFVNSSQSFVPGQQQFTGGKPFYNNQGGYYPQPQPQQQNQYYVRQGTTGPAYQPVNQQQ